MKRALRFRLNGTLFEINEREEQIALDWIRHEQRLTGTKEGCREGDCGACMVLLGERTPGERGNAEMCWRSALSCLLALGELDGRHLITIEGIAAGGLTPVMEAMLEEGASQCGFCSPGFVVSITGYLIGGGAVSIEGARKAVEGNFCRCTGYASIERALQRLVERFASLPASLPERIARLAAEGVIPRELAELMLVPPEPAAAGGAPETAELTLGGGTDYFVRNPDPLPQGAVAFADREPALREITREGKTITLGASVTVEEFFESRLVREALPGIERYEALFASLPIRTRATLAGNIMNASPIGDMTALLLALRASARVRRAGSGRGAALPREGSRRTIPLEEFFVSYRRTALEEGESLEALLVPVPERAARVILNFEKVAKRSHLDIASANSACLALADEEGRIIEIAVSAGGVAPVPMRLSKTEEYLRGRVVGRLSARRAAEIAASECSPIDDVRGTAAYRRSLIRRFLLAHLMRIAPAADLAKEVIA